MKYILKQIDKEISFLELTLDIRDSKYRLPICKGEIVKLNVTLFDWQHSQGELLSIIKRIKETNPLCITTGKINIVSTKEDTQFQKTNIIEKKDWIIQFVNRFIPEKKRKEVMSYLKKESNNLGIEL